MEDSSYYPRTVSSQVTDAVTQVNVEVVGMAPAVSQAQLQISMAQASALSAFNQVSQFNNTQIQSLASSAKSTQMMLANSSKSRTQRLIETLKKIKNS